MSILADPRIKVVLNEALRHRRLVFGLFIGINLLALTAALVWPRGYVVYTTILVSDRNIIQPLLQGAAATTTVNDRARIAREIINGRKVMNQVIDMTGWTGPATVDSDREKLIEYLNRRIAITNVGSNLIKIEYRDGDPDRAFRTTRTLADVFIKESIEAKGAESQAAFEFIDHQTQEYHEKLMKMEEQLKEFRIANVDIRPGGEGDVNARMNALQTRIEQSQQDLKEAEIKKQSLERQLSGEAETTTTMTREGQYRSRLAELQSQLQTLRLSYHDTYPDIVRIRHQIDDLNEAISTERQRRDRARAEGASVIDESVVNNPMYQQLKRDLSQTQVQIDMLKARIGEAKQQLNQVVNQGKRIHGGEATVAELTRDYQVNREIYQDLLKRRESARVSMNMDKQNQGLTFKVQEPAARPTNPSGLRFGHFIAIGLLLGLFAPFGLIYGWKLQADPHIRLPGVLSENYKLPMMVVVPHLWSNRDKAVVDQDITRLTLAVMATLAAIVLFSSLAVVGVV
jgi:polysaccharide chain length determinant protein (PEP-CTERM system associated)